LQTPQDTLAGGPLQTPQDATTPLVSSGTSSSR
jgi:hypothetical protein